MTVGFPHNIVEVFQTLYKERMPDHEIITRPVRIADPNLSLGIYVMDWMPDMSSLQIGQEEPALARYRIRLQNLIKHTDEQEARGLFATSAKIVRVILVRDPALRVRLTELQEEILNSRERLLRFGVAQQSFLNNKIDRSFTFLATTDVWVETETVQL